LFDLCDNFALTDVWPLLLSHSSRSYALTDAAWFELDASTLAHALAPDASQVRRLTCFCRDAACFTVLLIDAACYQTLQHQKASYELQGGVGIDDALAEIGIPNAKRRLKKN
jgi:hypothetical protein